MFEALGRVMYRRRRWVVALAVAFVVFAGVWGTGVFGAMTGGGFEDPGSESSKAAAGRRPGARPQLLRRRRPLPQRRPDRRRPGLPERGRPSSLAARARPTCSRGRRPSGAPGSRRW